jgi:hypothetical protein
MPQFIKVPQSDGYTWINLETVSAATVKVIGGKVSDVTFALLGGGEVSIENRQEA